jgi:hypothetical protein
VKTSQAAPQTSEHAHLRLRLAGPVLVCPRSARASRLDRKRLDTFVTNSTGQAGWRREGYFTPAPLNF